MTRPLLGVLALFVFAGCAHSAPAQPAAPASAVAPAYDHDAMMAMCPTDVLGTEVVTTDTASGETAAFITKSDQVTELQRRVHAMVEMHNQHQTAAGGMMGGSNEIMMLPPSHAAVVDLPNGARIDVTPNAPADLLKLQSAVRMHAQRMTQTHCGTMNHAQGR